MTKGYIKTKDSNPLLNNDIEVPQKGKYTLFREFQDFNKKNNTLTNSNSHLKSHSVEPMKSNELENLRNPYKLKPKKMDQFLRYTQYGQTDSELNSYRISTNNNTKDSNKSEKHSFYFMGPERFNQRHLKKTGFDSQYHNLNHLVTDPKLSMPRIPQNWKKENYDTQHKSSERPLRNIHKPEMSQSNYPSARRTEIQHLLQELKQQKDEIKEQNLRIKRNYVLNNAYKSGVISLDNPENPESQLYHKEQQKIHKINQNHARNKDIRQLILKFNRGTSEGIEFCNLPENEQNIDKKGQNSLKNIRKSCNLNKSFDDDFKAIDARYSERTIPVIRFASRKKVRGGFMDKFQTTQEIITHNAENDKITKTYFNPINHENIKMEQNKRKDQLFYQDRRGKSYDIISPTRAY